MPPFSQNIEPVALPGEAVRTVPDGDVYSIKAIEQMARLGPFDYGDAASKANATENGSDRIELDDELEMGANTIGQFWINPLSNVEIEVRQAGQAEQRFVNSNQVGVITPSTPTNQRQVFVHENDVPYLKIQNNTAHDMDKTLVYYTGYKFYVGDRPMDGEQINRLGGEPATIPTESLKRAYGGA